MHVSGAGPAVLSTIAEMLGSCWLGLILDTGNEPAGNGYARKPVKFNVRFSDGALEAVSSMDVATPIASGVWGSVTGIGLYADASGQDALWLMSFDSPRSISKDDRMVLPAGSVVISMGVDV